MAYRWINLMNFNSSSDRKSFGMAYYKKTFVFYFVCSIVNSGMIPFSVSKIHD